MSEFPKSAARRTGQHVFKSAHFALSWRPTADHSHAESADDLGLMMAVPKKLLKRAVDRNAVRRVAREVWRVQAANLNRAGLARPLLRLTSRPSQWTELSRPQRKRFWRTELDALINRAANAQAANHG